MKLDKEIFYCIHDHAASLSADPRPGLSQEGHQALQLWPDLVWGSFLLVQAVLPNVESLQYNAARYVLTVLSLYLAAWKDDAPARRTVKGGGPV